MLFARYPYYLVLRPGMRGTAADWSINRVDFKPFGVLGMIMIGVSAFMLFRRQKAFHKSENKKGDEEDRNFFLVIS